MEEKLIQLLEKSKKPLTFEKICEKVEANDTEKELILKYLNHMVDDYSLIYTAKGNYVSIGKTSFRKGKFIADKDGRSGIVIVKSNEKSSNGEVFVKKNIYKVLEKDMNGAIDGDLVFVNIYSQHKNGTIYADIKKIISRSLNLMFGEVYKSGNGYYVKSLDKKKRNVIVKLDDYEVDGTKVLVHLINQNEDGIYNGHVLRKFNQKFDPTDDIIVEAYKCGLTDEFSEETLHEIKKIPQVVRDVDKIGRLDLTNEKIFTIDCVDTKDIDDAISGKFLDNGNFSVGIHIADVSNYVKSGSAIDKDAYERGTSAYLANKVIPMLGCELSNGICSLNPNEERLAISVFAELDKNASIVNSNIKLSVIKSKMKMNYDEVNAILNNNSYNENYLPYIESLNALNEYAVILREKRIENGALNFDKKEIKLLFDDNDNVIGIEQRNHDLAEKLIEEYMILGNEIVDRFLVSHGYTPLHRVHDEPISKKVKNFLKLLNTIGCNYKEYDYFECLRYQKYFQDLEKHIRETGKFSNALSTNLIKCMAKAKYSPNNIGHFGLAKDYYCHFTSPIRRYPDLVNHRLVKLALKNGNDKSIMNNLEEYGLHTSSCERKAMEAEINVLKMKVAEYLSHHIGEEYEGLVIDINSSGLFIQLENCVEGKVNLNILPGKYLYKEDSFTLESLDNFPSYTIGDYLKLKLIEASKEKKAINFQVLEKIEDIKSKKLIKNNK